MVKANVLVSKGELEVRDYPEPEKIDDCLLINVDAAGVCGTDPHIYSGTRVGATYPVILGHEICGTVEKVGSKYKSASYDEVSEGDRIIVVPGKTCGQCFYCKTLPHMENLCIDRKIYGVTMCSEIAPHLFGGFAEKMVVLPGYWTYKLPENVSPEVGALAEPMAVAVRAVERAFAPGLPYVSQGIGIGSTVVIQGAGTIGLFATMAAKISGAEVITLDKIVGRLDMAKKFGASETVNVGNLTPEERISLIKELTNSVGADVAIECTGELDAFEEGVQMIRRGGRYIEMGNFADIGFAKIKPSYVCRNDIEIVGSVIAPPQDFRRVMYIFENFDFPFADMITNTYKIEDVEKAIKGVVNKQGIKTLIKS